MALSIYEIKAGCTFQNIKTGNPYYVMAVGIHTENYEVLVTYRNEDGEIFHRPLGLFCWKFKHNTGEGFLTNE